MIARFVQVKGPTGDYDYAQTQYRHIDALRAFSHKHDVTLIEGTCQFTYVPDGESRTVCEARERYALRVEFI